MKIIDVEFVGKGQVSIYAILDDGSRHLLLNYFDDELSFTKEELIGLTVKEACDLHMKKDTAYLQS